MEERRRLDRRQVNKYLGVYEQNSDKLLGCLVDLNTEGLQILGKLTFRYEEVYKIRLSLHREIEGARDLCFDAKNVWCKEHIELGMFASGFEFQKVGEETKERVENLIESSAFKKVPAELLK